MFTKISLAAIIIAIIIVVIAAFSVMPQSKIYTYKNPSNKFTIQYPNTYDITQNAYDKANGENNRIGFVSKGTDGPWLMVINIEPTIFTTIDQMVKTTNEKRAHPIRIEKTEEDKGVTWFYLKTPIVVDHTMDDQEILADGDSVVFIKDKKLYTFQLREQMGDQQVASDFLRIVKSFQFTDAS